MTLLDCLHTFCGACLKEWFTYQASTAERSRSSPESGSSIVNCPSCRASVRDTKHNATVVTLLDMFVAAHPEKARSEVEKEEMAGKYKPGDQVLPQIRRRRRTSAERRAEAEDQRLINEVRELSLREATGGSSQPRHRRRRESRSVDAHARSSREHSPESSSRQRRVRDRYQADESGRRSSDQLLPDGARRRRRRSEDGSRRVEHQSSLRSLIGSENMSEREIQREIEDFARQIQEEGLLDGLDLDNIDLSRDDELSRRLAEAYRRRQRERERERPRHDASSRRSTASNQSRPTELTVSDSRPPTSDRRSRSDSRQRPHSRSMSSTGHAENRSRPPPSMPVNLDVRDRTRRRAGSNGRRSTAPISPSPAEARPATRSQTDLALRTQPAELAAQRPNMTDARSSSTPTVSTAAMAAATELPGSTSSTGTNTPVLQTNNQSFANRMPPAEPTTAPPPPPPAQAPTAPPPADNVQVPASASTLRAHRPAELAMVHSAVSSPLSSPTVGGHQRKRSQLYPEPSITCSRCSRTHIEYELHYNCNVCAGGQWNICLSCYRGGKGCQYWFGFGYGAWKKWEHDRELSGEDMVMPHMLTACRYLPPPNTPGGADGRKTLTTDDPRRRLESGTFCVRCHAWTNLCYWRCDVCNEGDWGYCNDCVNQGYCCTHMLLPLTHEATQQNQHGRPNSPRSPGRPPAAAVLTGPQASSIGPFKPLIFNTRCDVCQDPIAPNRARYHCYSCTSSLVPDTSPGDYDICTSCYKNLVSQGQISTENGYAGWRRCLNGHRMVIVGFTEGKVGQWRYVDRDLVGGRTMTQNAYEGTQHHGKVLEKWTWKRGTESWTRLVTKDVKDTAPTSDESTALTDSFPPEGGLGNRAMAKWSWFPQVGADDELLFPRGGEVREIEDVNGDWYYGTYMGAKGLFPAPYVRLAQD